jgi:hypothetical protein
MLKFYFSLFTSKGDWVIVWCASESRNLNLMLLSRALNLLNFFFFFFFWSLTLVLGVR